MAENNFRADRLEETIHTYGIELDENVKWDNEKMIKVLGDYFISLEPQKYSWGTRYVQSLSTPMLCKHLKDDIDKFKVSPLESADYVAETKLNGCRCVAVYSPETGFEFFTRRESSSNYLNGNLTNKFLFIEKGLISEPKDYVNKFNYRFVLDGELLIDNIENELQTTQISIEDYIQSVFSSNAERAKEFQRDGHRMYMVVFDVLYFEKNPVIPADWEPKYNYEEREITPEVTQWVESHYPKYLESAGFTSAGKAKKLYQYLYTLKDTNKNDVRKYPFSKRRELRSILVNMLRKNLLPFYEVESEDENKIEFTENILSSGGEGCFKSSCRVNMADGTLKSIKEVQIGDEVLSFNTNTNTLERKKVLRKIDNGLKPSEQWLSVSHGAFQSSNIANKQNRFKRIMCTSNHNFFDGIDYSPIEKLSHCYELSANLGNYRYQALIGWLLSDGSIDKNGVITLTQKESSSYWTYTKGLFGPFTSNGCIKTQISGKGSRIGILCINKEYCIPFQNFREDKIQYINQMNEIAIAYLIMGDGARNKSTIEISTHSLQENEVQAIVDRMTVLFGDIKYTLKKDKRVKNGAGLSIYIWQESFDKIKGRIMPYIHPSERYKVGESEIPFVQPPLVGYHIKKVPIFKKSLNEYVNFKARNIRAWDLEIEDNHNFFVENVLVHNSIIKNLHAPYISGLRSTRGHRAAMKVKQSIDKMLCSDSALAEDFDVFITGANPPKSSRIKNMIGSLSCSIYIKKDDGTLVEHEIANVTGISHDWKKKLALVDEETGKISLNPEYEGKVIAIDGLALTASKLKFQHAKLKNNGILEFKAKNPTECVWDESVLKEMTLVRGK